MATIDHFFVFTQLDAPEQERLIARGLQVGARRDHRGQGTRNVCFGFLDSYLEMLWLADEDAARHVMVKPLGLQERMRWRHHHASPFGICLRPDTADETPPFAHWDYKPDYLPADMAIRMACNSGVIGEPLLLQIDRPAEPMIGQHALSQHRLEKLTITTPDLAPMSMLHELAVDRLLLQGGNEHLMEIEFSSKRAAGEPTGGHELDLRPELPIVLRW